MRKGDGSLILCQAGEHLQEYLLGEVFLGHAPGQVGPDNPDDKGVEMFHKFSRSNLIAHTNAIETASQIERLVVRHRDMETGSNTSDKTALGVSRLQLLDFPDAPPIYNGNSMRTRAQALRLTCTRNR